MAVNRGSRLDFTPRPTLFFLPAGFCCLVSSIEETPSGTALQLENYGFDQLVSQRDWHHLLNEKSGSGEPVCPDGTFAAGYTRDAWERWQIVCLAALSVEGRWRYLPFRHHDNRYSADWIRLYPGLSKNSEDGNSCSKSHKVPVLIEAVGRAVSNETETINRNMDTIMMKLAALEVKFGDFRGPEWTKRMSCGNFAAVRPKSHNNLILSFWLPVPAPWPRPSGFTTLRERCSEDSLAPFPPLQTLLPSPIQLPSEMLCTATRASRSETGAAWHWTGWLLAELDMFPPVAMSCVYGICAFVLRCFFSVLRLYSNGA